MQATDEPLHGLLLVHHDETPRPSPLPVVPAFDGDLLAFLRALDSPGRCLVALDALAGDELALTEWKAAGMTGVCLRVEGHVEALHRAVLLGSRAWRRRDFDLSQIHQLAAECRAGSLEVHIRTRVARSNFRSLGAIAEQLAAIGARSWTLELPELEHAEAPPEGVAHAAGRLSLTLPWALRALSGARKRGIDVALRGAPMCLMGPLATLAVVPDAERAFAEGPCTPCAVRSQCSGVSATYLDRFGASELNPRREAPASNHAWWTLLPCL